MIDVIVARFDVNIEALESEIRAVFGARSLGVSTGPYGVNAHLADDATPSEIAQVEQIILNHDPAVLTPEQIAAAHAAQVEANSESDITAIPNWAHWDEETVLAWIEAHTGETKVNAITNLPQAKAVLLDMSTQLTALSRLCVALRNKVYPNLET